MKHHLIHFRSKVNNIGSGRVFETGEFDDIFIYFVDHGAKESISFPSSNLDAKTLQKTLMQMHSKRLYNKMLIYLESCESGSMFEGFLPTDLNILAVTASNSTESSYACFYNETMNTFLADVFSYRKLKILINPTTELEVLNPNIG